MSVTRASDAPRLFGTDGIRGRAGDAPIDARTMRRIGSALARVLGRELSHAPRVVIGRDTRESGRELAQAIASGLLHAGGTVRSAGVVPTPAVSLLARSDEFDIGVMISASHNPWTDNGVKVFSSRGTKLRDELEREVEQDVARTEDEQAAGAPELEDEPDLGRRHGDWLVARARRTGIDLNGIRLVIDCANGAASELALRVFQPLGADVETLATTPDGRNINHECGALHLDSLAAAVTARRADLGVAFDGDADRAIFIDSRGREADGDVVLLVAARALLRQRALETRTVVGTVMSNLGLERELDTLGVVLVRERVGDRFVLERMLAEGHELGGEPSGHVIFRDVAPTGDGLSTALELLRSLDVLGETLDAALDAFPRAPQATRVVRIRSRPPLEELVELQRLAGAWRERLADGGRLLVRYSGTEPAARVMVEGEDETLVHACADELADCLRQTLGEETP